MTITLTSKHTLSRNKLIKIHSETGFPNEASQINGWLWDAGRVQRTAVRHWRAALASRAPPPPVNVFQSQSWASLETLRREEGTEQDLMRACDARNSESECESSFFLTGSRQASLSATLCTNSRTSFTFAQFLWVQVTTTRARQH